MYRNWMALQLLLLLATAGCGGRGREFYPLGESEKWTYQATTKSTVEANRSTSITIVNMAKRDLEGRSVTPQKTEANGQTFFSFMGEDSDGVFLLANQAPNSTEPEIIKPPPYLLHRPYEKGTKWEVQSSSQTSSTGGPVTLQATIQSADEIVTVPAGTFEGCLKVVAQGEQVKNLGAVMGQAKVSLEQISWFCPGVGLVKSVDKTTSNNPVAMNGSGEFSLQLESHENK